MAIKVKLRKKKITKGRLSLYLDYYPPIENKKTGKLTRREFLGMYIFEKPKSVFDKKHNKEMIEIAEQIRNKREDYLSKPEIYTEYEKEQLKKAELGKQCFVEYFKKQIDKRTGSNYKAWLSALNYLESFTNGTVKFKDLNELFFNDFKEYLLNTKSYRSDKTKLATNSAVSYFNKVKATLKQAYKDGLLQQDLNAKISPIKTADTKKEYLTLQELNKLVKTHCNNDLLKRASLFSALTGLRFSDIKKLKWKEIIQDSEQQYSIDYTQQKTKNIELLPISVQAVSLLGEKREPEQYVFEGLKYSAFQNKHLYQWIGNAGITKNITFHSFRHTYATLQLFNGTDITTVSKMLGHKDLKTTMIYAKIVDEAKREATNKINLDM